MQLDAFELLTERLRLRMPRIEDATAIEAIASDRRVAEMTASIPHPYPEGSAAEFIERVRAMADRDRQNLAITLRDTGALVGMVGYEIKNSEAELAYMVSPSHWGRGYATEACKRLVTHVFAATDAIAVWARVMAANKASEAVLRKAGLRWQREAPVELPMRGGTFVTTYWRLARDER
jgi:RimJ/RimL family protein N-acetyltransferase